jgi:hypothetical protein
MKKSAHDKLLTTSLLFVLYFDILPARLQTTPFTMPANDSPTAGGRIAIFAACCVPYSLLVWKFWFVCDDALISFRYSRNLALGNGLRYNLGDQLPVEGFSNGLWVLVGAVIEFLHLDITFWSPVLSALCGATLLYLVLDRMERRLGLARPAAAMATLLLATLPPYACWSTGGLETMPFALLIFLLFDRLLLSDTASLLSTVAATIAVMLIRVEGPAWVVVLVALTLLFAESRQMRMRALAVLAVVVVGTAAITAARWGYYHDVIPNTVHAKSGLPRSYLWRGFNYVAVHALTFVTPLAIAITSWFAFRKQRLTVGIPIAAMAWAFPTYAIVTTGDFMTMGRFLIPSMPFAAILLGFLLDDLLTTRARPLVYITTAAMLAVQAAPAWNAHLVPHSVRAKFNFRYSYRSELNQWNSQRHNAQRWSLLGRALRAWVATQPASEGDAEPMPSLVRGAIGGVGYHSDLFIHDKMGLVSREVARRPLDPSKRKWRYPSKRKWKSPGHDRTVRPLFFLDKKPTLVDARLIWAQQPIQAAKKLLRRPRINHAMASKHYVGEFARIESKTGGSPYLIVWRRLRAGEDGAQAWARFHQQLQLLSETGQSAVVLTVD